jgi:hypothetical protein
MTPAGRISAGRSICFSTGLVPKSDGRKMTGLPAVPQYAEKRDICNTIGEIVRDDAEES